MKPYPNNWIKLVLITLLQILISLFHLQISIASDLIPGRTPSTGYQPQMKVSGDKIHYVWHEYDGPFRQIFTAEMNIDGTGWRAEKRTSGQYDKVFPQLQVVENKIYYVRQQPDATKNRQIWTMEMNMDGTGWKEIQRTNTPFDKQFPQLQVVENRIYYTWNESDGKYRQIWTAEMNIDGTGWKATKRTSSPFEKFEPQLQAGGDKIYFVWRESDGGHFQIWTALMNRDGTGWQAIQRTNTPLDKYTPQLQVHGDKIYYVWEESDGKYRQIWTASVKKDGTGWKSEKRTKSSYGKYDPQLQIVGNKIYYVWHEDHGPIEPIWVAIEAPTIR